MLFRGAFLETYQEVLMCFFPGDAHDTRGMLVSLERGLQLDKGLVLCCHAVKSEAAAAVRVASSKATVLGACWSGRPCPEQATRF